LAPLFSFFFFSFPLSSVLGSSPLSCCAGGGKEKHPRALGFVGGRLGFYRQALGLGLVLTAAWTPRIAPRVAVRGRDYVARIKGISDLGSGSRLTGRAGAGVSTGK